MARLLTIFMMLAFLVTQGASVNEAICRHGSAAAHALALGSADRQVAAQAMAEDDAGSVVSKKGSLSHGGSVSAPNDFVTPSSVTLPFRAVERVSRILVDGPALAGLSIPPLLQPPLA